MPDSTEPVQVVELTIRPLARGREDVMPSVYTESEVSDETRVPKPFYGLIYASADRVTTACGFARADLERIPSADLGVGEWSEWWIDSFEIEGNTAEGYVRMKLVTLTATADAFELFVPQIWPKVGYTVPDTVATTIDTEIGSFLQIRRATRSAKWTTTPILKS